MLKLIAASILSLTIIGVFASIMWVAWVFPGIFGFILIGFLIISLFFVLTHIIYSYFKGEL